MRSEQLLAVGIFAVASVVSSALGGREDGTPPPTVERHDAPFALDAPTLTPSPVPSATPEASMTPVPTETPTPLPANATARAGGNDDAPPSGNRAEWPADVQARERALLFALAESPWPSSLWPAVLTISYCESTWNPGAIGSGGHRGLMQIAPIHIPTWIAGAGFGWDDMLLPGPNLAVAYALYLDQSWQPWSCRYALN